MDINQKQEEAEQDNQLFAGQIVYELEEAHYNAAINNHGNISATVAMMTYQGSSDPVKAIAAALLTTGGSHAPLVWARSLISSWSNDEEMTRNQFAAMVKFNQRIPGLGNSFYKDAVDPSFQLVHDMIIEHEGPECSLVRIPKYVNFLLSEKKGKEVNLFPNAAMITGCACEAIGAKKFFEIYLFIMGRTQAWISLMNSSKRDGPPSV